MRAALLSLVLGCVVIAPTVAHADNSDVPARARTLAQRGRALHDAGDYAGAIAAFTEAYALAPSPALLFNLAQAYRLAGRCEDASTMYNRFLATEPPAEARTLAETNLMSVDQCVAGLKPVVVSVATPASVVVTAKPVVLSAPERHAAIEHDAGVGLMIGGGFALIGSLAYEMRAHDDSQSVSQSYQHGGPGGAIAATDAAGRHDAALADVFGITGVVALAAGGTLLYMGSHESHARHLAVLPASHGAQVQAAWRF